MFPRPFKIAQSGHTNSFTYSYVYLQDWQFSAGWLFPVWVSCRGEAYSLWLNYDLYLRLILNRNWSSNEVRSESNKTTAFQCVRRRCISTHCLQISVYVTCKGALVDRSLMTSEIRGGSSNPHLLFLVLGLGSPLCPSRRLKINSIEYYCQLFNKYKYINWMSM